MLADVYVLRRMALSFLPHQLLTWGKPASLCCEHNAVFVTAFSVCNTCTYPLAPYFWVFAFILSGWTVLCPVRKASFFSLLSADVLAVENGVK